MIVLLKTTTKNQKFFPTLLLKTIDFQLFFSRRVHWRAWYNESCTMMAKPIRAPELHYLMIQFLIKGIINH